MRSIIDSWEITQDVQYEIVEMRQDVENDFVVTSNSVAEFYFLLIKIIKKNETLRNKLNEFKDKLSEPFPIRKRAATIKMKMMTFFKNTWFVLGRSDRTSLV